MTGPHVDIRVTGEREHCELAVSRMRELFQLTDITGPVHARYSWPQVHVLVTACLTTTTEPEEVQRDDRG